MKYWEVMTSEQKVAWLLFTGDTQRDDLIKQHVYGQPDLYYATCVGENVNLPKIEKALGELESKMGDLYGGDETKK